MFTRALLGTEGWWSLALQIGGGRFLLFFLSKVFFNTMASRNYSWYDDLDAPAAIEETVRIANATLADSLSGPSSSSGGSNNKKRLRASDKDPTIPPHEYLVFLRRAAMEYFRVRSLEMLQRSFLNHAEHGLLLLQADVERELSARLQESEEYNNALTYFGYSPWMARQVVANTTNVIHTFDMVYKKPKGEEHTAEEKELRLKLKEVQTFASMHSSQKNRVMPWNENALKASFEKHMNHGIVWVPQVAKILPIDGHDVEGGYGKVRKVRISGMKGISLHIEFAGKLPTARTEKEKREQRSLEAMVCPISHPGVIKFWALHPQSMEAYTLWWNGQNLSKFWQINSKASKAASANSILSNQAITMEESWRINAYRKNRAKLAWALMCIMEKIHKAKLLHNDIGPANVMLHFPPDKLEEVYIGVCDWGLASRMVESEASRYGYASTEALDRVRAARPFVAPELFYTFGAPNSDTALDRMQRQHPFTELADSFSVGSLAAQIWRGEPDNDLFKGQIGFHAFHSKISALKERDVHMRSTVSQVVEDLTGSIYNFEIPKTCYRNTI